jgi:L,D-transpeptidase ErfK/SrfK
LQMNHGRVEDVLTVNDATGKSAKSTPEGRFHVLEKELHPWWYPPKSIGGHPVPPGPDNPLGPAKIRTDYPGGKILLHGTSRPDQIGTNASHGCIRHNNKDIMKIYPLVEKGDAIYIVKNFNSATIRPEDFGRRR